MALSTPHASGPEDESAPRRLRVASYNIFKGRYLGGGASVGAGAARARSRDARSLLADCASCDGLRGADVLLVQEALIGAVQRGAASIDSVAALAGALGFPPEVDAARHVRFFGAPHGHSARWGVAILSRYPAVFHDVPLPRPRWSPWPRGAILAEIGSFIVATLHLEVWPIGAPARRRQIATVLEAIAALPESSTRPIVLAGDFNCERGAPHDLLRRAGFTAVPMAAPTWSFAGVRLRLDHAYVRGAHVAAAGVERSARGSDHRPLWAEVEADGGSAAAHAGR